MIGLLLGLGLMAASTVSMLAFQISLINPEEDS